MKRWLMQCFAILVCLFSSITSAEVPLPQDVSISAPDPTLKKELSALSGRWVGNWGGNLDAILIVEQISTEGAQVIYAWGDYAPWNVTANYRRYEAKINQSDKAEIQFASKAETFTVKINSDFESIQIRRVNSRSDKTETFRRAKP